MQNQELPTFFDKERSDSYAGQYAKLAPLRNAIHLLARVILSDLPADARVLCVGAGTGAELVFLAHEFPQGLLDAWLWMQAYTGTPAEAIAKMPASYERDLAVLPTAEVASLIAAGFDAPTPFYQALLIHAWYARKTP